jgi:hypothetical protein
MKYHDGREVYISDKVIADDSDGVVVSVLDTKQFSQDYPEGWIDSDRGVFIETRKWGLIHYTELDEDVELIERAKT